MKYRYAQTANGETVDILDLSRGRPRRHEQFICFSCERGLVPVLGLRREKHFRHRFEGEAPCSPETYLHALAKKQIIDGFLGAVRSGKPYNLTFPIERHCLRWKDELGYICERPTGRRDIDLTRHFDSVQEEAAVRGFVADVLLTSSKSNKELLIEVAVTHRCEPSKISSGLRIVEVSVNNEDQIDALVTGIDVRSNNVATHNLIPLKPLRADCLSSCGTELTAFFVYKSGKSRILTQIPARIAEERRRSSTIYSRVIHDIPELPIAYRSEALQALSDGIPIKCCFLCRYAGFDTWEKPVFCKIRRTEVGVNEAADCSAYRPTLMTER
ncbi:competence protein CoiA family protein [Ensifer aridi]|uniref:competence protein CoiA family protein n=1 Tax=Ensifer aridi TaxID=1708715 RepID=UPI0011116650|nr:competence protein CoiA family protein [Ensifer aridi]